LNREVSIAYKTCQHRLLCCHADSSRERIRRGGSERERYRNMLRAVDFLGHGRAISRDFTREETFALELYLFHLVSLVISGALAYSYDFYFILGLTIGTLRWGSVGNHQPTGIAA
jgi:hypothetical protein